MKLQYRKEVVVINLIVCDSGSDGNTYLLNSDDSCVVLDCGVDLKTVKRHLGFKVKHIKFALCTHIHKDHSRYISEYLKMGIKVYMPKQVKEQYKGEYDAIEVDEMKRFSIDGFSIIPFEVPHDEDVTCYAYIIENESFGKLLYMTDCMYCKYNLKKLKINHLLCECNYSKDLVDENYEMSLRNRVLKTHMELETVKEFIKANKSNAFRNVILCHLSKENLNPIGSQAEVEKTANCPVYVAEKGFEIELSEFPF